MIILISDIVKYCWRYLIPGFSEAIVFRLQIWISRVIEDAEIEKCLSRHRRAVTLAKLPRHRNLHETSLRRQGCRLLHPLDLFAASPPLTSSRSTILKNTLTIMTIKVPKKVDQKPAMVKPTPNCPPTQPVR